MPSSHENHNALNKRQLTLCSTFMKFVHIKQGCQESIKFQLIPNLMFHGEIWSPWNFQNTKFVTFVMKDALCLFSGLWGVPVVRFFWSSI